jgi:hypothetical protein
VHGDVHAGGGPWRPGGRHSALEFAVERLASAVRRQWETEAAIRSLRQPEPLRLRWSTTGRDVSAVAAASLRIQGDLTDVVDKFQTLPRRQLVILGEPGAGKTVLALLFTLGLLTQRARGEPVPVLLTVSSWDPDREHLDDWIARRLAEDYQALGNRRAYGRRAALRLVEEKRVVPVLDGLDELPSGLHIKAIEAINRAAGEKPLVLTCRTAEYHTAVTTSGTPLSAAAVVELERIDVEDAISFLSGRLLRTAARWEPVFAHLRLNPAGVLAKVFSTPLMVSLARTAYSPPAKDPAELLGFQDGATIEHHLLDSFLPTLYTGQPPAPPSPSQSRPPGPRRPYPPADAQRWLGFLAGHLDALRTRDLAWWRLPRPRSVLVVVYLAVLAGLALSNEGTLFVGLFLGISLEWLIDVCSAALRRESRRVRRRKRERLADMILLPGVLLGWMWFSRTDVTDVTTPATAFADVAGFGLVIALVLSSSKEPSRISFRASGRFKKIALRAAAGSAVGLVLGAALILISHATGNIAKGRTESWVVIFFGLFGLFVFGLAAWLTTASHEFGFPSPVEVFRGDRGAGLLLMLIPFAAFEMAVFYSRFVIGNPVGYAHVATAASFGLGFGIGLVLRGAWMSSLIPHGWWGLRGKLPWQLMRFLDDAHKRGVLRQAGPVYQFRHAHLQDRLAQQTNESSGH